MRKQLFCFFLACIPALIFCLIRLRADVSFDVDVGGHLKRAADANTVELATQELQTAITGLDAKGMTSGYTSLFYRTPDEDISFWYLNLRSALRELREISPNATQMERSNVLMKLRETLMDKTEGGERVTVPAGLQVYPNNFGYAAGLAVAVLIMIFGWYAAVTFVRVRY